MKPFEPLNCGSVLSQTVKVQPGDTVQVRFGPGSGPVLAQKTDQKAAPRLNRTYRGNNNTLPGAASTASPPPRCPDTGDRQGTHRGGFQRGSGNSERGRRGEGAGHNKRVPPARSTTSSHVPSRWSG
ncbi:unnamed protein product [Pleuronectes platessa]|uniref:Uncharacterized protein n=1 Tax=Pleuronectes platessa TaxID=8262 RepID=A0A9N7VLF5_PLEPL|nr:unnamed protein product [Pleuronectes platessa]